MSAERQAGRTLFIRLECAAALSCSDALVLHTDLTFPFIVLPDSVAVIQVAAGAYEVSGLESGMVALLYSKMFDPPELIIQADPGTPQQFNWWGTNGVLPDVA